jgi:hypothetical protein
MAADRVRTQFSLVIGIHMVFGVHLACCPENGFRVTRPERSHVHPVPRSVMFTRPLYSFTVWCLDTEKHYQLAVNESRTRYRLVNLSIRATKDALNTQIRICR